MYHIRASVASAVEGDVGGVSVPPRPMSTQIISSSSFNPLHHFRIPPAPSVLAQSAVPSVAYISRAFSSPRTSSVHTNHPARSIFIPKLKVTNSAIHSSPAHTVAPTHHAPRRSLVPTQFASSAVFSNFPSVPPSRSVKPRKPKAGCEIQNNDLRPHVAAADRLFTWQTPFGIRQQSQLQNLIPQTLINPVLMTIRSAYAPNSKSSYAAGILRWSQFCDKYSIPEESRMPASYALICGFIAEHKGLQTGGTIKGWLSGLRGWHLVNHAPWHGEDDPWVEFARAAAFKEGAVHKRAPRSPVSIEHLACLRRGISLSNPFHAAVWAVALCMFWGCRRLGETTITTEAAFDSAYHVLRSAPYAFVYS